MWVVSELKGVQILRLIGSGHLLLKNIREHLVLTKHPEQAGSMLKRSIILWNLRLRVLIVCRCEYRRDTDDTLSTESEPLGLKISWIKTNIQKFFALYNDSIDLPPSVAFLTEFCTLGELLAAGDDLFPEINRCLGIGSSVKNSFKLDLKVSIIVQMNKDQATPTVTV